MRRSSLITILLLVLIIVGLSVALVLTNLPQEEVEESVANSNEFTRVVETSKNKKVETPTQLSLTDDKAVEMATLLNSFSATNMFFEGLKDINRENVSNAEKIYAAFRYYVKTDTEGYVSRDEIAEDVKKLFGDVSYVDESVKGLFGGLNYEPDNQRYMIIVGGGGPRPYNMTGIYKIDEYSDRYEAYVKYLSVIPRIQYIDDNVYNGVLWTIYSNASVYSKELGNYTVSAIRDTGYPSIENYISGVVEKTFAKSNDAYNQNNYSILSKLYDEASEYKVTFMKNDDGSFYWLKTEVVK